MTVNVRKKRRYTILSRQTAPGKRIIVQRGGRRLYTLLSAVTLLGVLVGTFCGSGALLTEAVAAHGGGGFWVTFRDSLAILAIYTGLCFFGGLSSAGAPLGYLLCFFKGLGTGALCACIFSGGTANTPLRAAADILPFEAMSIALLIFSARENVRMSEITRKRTFEDISGDNALRKNADLGLYLKKFGVISLAAIAAAAADGLIGLLIAL